MSSVVQPGGASSSSSSVSLSSSCLYAFWLMPNRMLRDQLEPLLLINSSAALVTLTAKHLHIQVIDRFITSAFQRTFWAGVDYQLCNSDPLLAPSSSSSATISAAAISANAGSVGEAILFEATLDLGGIHDVLSGTTPSTMALLGHGPRRTSSSLKKQGGNDDEREEEEPTGNDDDDDQEEEEKEEDASDADNDEKKAPRRKPPSSSSSSSSSSAANVTAGGRGRRSEGVLTLANREEKVVWRFTCPNALDVKVRFVVLQPTQKLCHSFHSEPFAAATNDFGKFESPMIGGTTSQAPPVGVGAGMGVGFVGGFVARVSGWEKISLIPSAPLTNVIDFSGPPRFYRFDTNGGWLNPTVGARVSMRCTSDLQDDFMNLVTFSETCEMAITNGDMQLMARSKRAKKAYVLRYEQPYEFDATPTPTPPPTTTNTANAAKNKKRAPNSAPLAPSSAKEAQAPLPRRPVHNTPRFYVEYIHKNMMAKALRCAFLLRSFRIIHKLIGASSRIEWIIHQHAPPNNPTQTPSPKPAHAPNVNVSGPVICTFYQGTLAAERIVGVLMSLRLK